MDKSPEQLGKLLAEAISAGDIDASMEIIEKLIKIDTEIQFRILPKHPKQEIIIEHIPPQQEEVKYNVQPEATLLPPSHAPRKAAFIIPPQMINNKNVPSSNLTKSQINLNPEIDGEDIPILSRSQFIPKSEGIPDIPNQKLPPMPPKSVQPNLNYDPPYFQENPTSISRANIPNPSQNKINDIPNPVIAPIHKSIIPNPPQNELDDLPPYLAPAPIPNLNPYGMAPQVPDPLPNLNLNPHDMAPQVPGPRPVINVKPYDMAPKVPDPVPDVYPNVLIYQQINAQKNIEKDPAPDLIPYANVPQGLNVKKNIENKNDFQAVLNEQAQEPQNNENNIPPENANHQFVDLTEEELEQRKQQQAQARYEIARQLVEITGTDIDTAMKISARVSSLEAAFQLFYG